MFKPYNAPQAAQRAEDSEDQRIGQSVKVVEGSLTQQIAEMSENDCVIIGYPDDRGVERNHGRTGAADGPDAIRSYFYNMTPATLKSSAPRIWDLGNLRCWSMELTEAQEEARKVIARLREKNLRIFTLGGGHDWAWPDLADWNGGPIFHFDAHLDMRPNPKDPHFTGHSGTAFRRILEKAHTHIDLNVLGLQQHCNAKSHLKFAESYQIPTLFLEEMPSRFEDQMQLIHDKFNLKSKHEKFAFSVDMDVFPQSQSPGVSAPQSLGLDPALVFKLIQQFALKIKHLGIYETNPRYDRDGQSARLAAKILHSAIFCA